MNRLSKSILGLFPLLIISILFTPVAHSEIATFRKDTDNCRPISLTENVSATLVGTPGRGCSFSVDVRAVGDWVVTGAYFDSPPYGWGGDNWFTIDERLNEGDGNPSMRPYTFTCSQPSYTIDQSWLPSFVTLTSSTNLAGSGVGVPQGKRYTFQVGATAPVGTSFDIPLSFSATCNMYINKSGTIMYGEPVTMSSGNCKNQTVVNINPRGAQLDHTVTISGSSCLGPTSTPAAPTPTRTPSPTRTPTPTPTSFPTPPSAPTGSCPAGTQLLFQNVGPLPVGASTALGGTVTSAVTPWAPAWEIEVRDGMLLAWNNTGITVTFPQNVILQTAIMFDHDPVGKGGPGWSINGVQLPWGVDDTWSAPYNLNITSNQMVFDYGSDSPHFNVCVRAISGTPVPTATPDPSDTPAPPTATPTAFHTACSAISCVAVAGAGANLCNPEGGFCKQTITGAAATGSCPSACGTSTTNQSCTCSGPCCPGTCKNGLLCGETKPVTCCTSTQPQGPTGVTITQPDGGTIIHTRFVKINWNFPNGAPGCGSAWGHNCAGNGNNSFSIYIDDDDDFSTRIIDVDNIPPGTRTYTTTIADGILRNNTTYYAQVCANNYLASCTEVSFIKRAYPVGIISGSLGEFDNQSPGNEFSLTGIGSTTTNFDVNPVTSSTGITTTCSTTTSGTPPKTNSYNCTINLDNINADPLPIQPAIVVAIGFNPQLYTSPCFQTGATTCDSNTQVNIDYDTNGSSNPIINQNIYFTLNPGLTFMKIKNTSIISHGSLSTPFPVFTTLFDASGDDYNNDGNFLIIGNNSASINGVGTGIFGGTPPLGSGLVSRKSTPPYPPGENWMAKNYFPVTPFNNQRFLEYVKTRKSYKSITNLNQLETDKVNVWAGSLPLKINNAAHFNSKNVVLVVAGVVDMSTNNFTPALPSSTAIIADRINFYDGAQTVDEAHGIFIGNIIDFGVSTDPLKITGNLSSTTTAVNMSRVRLDNRKPSLFITFDVDQYMNLLPYMSTATYDWKQLQ